MGASIVVSIIKIKKKSLKRSAQKSGKISEKNLKFLMAMKDRFGRYPCGCRRLLCTLPSRLPGPAAASAVLLSLLQDCLLFGSLERNFQDHNLWAAPLLCLLLSGWSCVSSDLFLLLSWVLLFFLSSGETHCF